MKDVLVSIFVRELQISRSAFEVGRLDRKAEREAAMQSYASYCCHKRQYGLSDGIVTKRSRGRNSRLSRKRANRSLRRRWTDTCAAENAALGGVGIRTKLWWLPLSIKPISKVSLSPSTYWYVTFHQRLSQSVQAKATAWTCPKAHALVTAKLHHLDQHTLAVWP